MAVPKELLDILACALCKSDVKLKGEKLYCTNPDCNLIYPVKEDIPVMLIDEAERPCPKCKTQRDWREDVLSCPKCAATFKYQSK